MKQELDITNIGTWIHDLDEEIFRFLTYKKVWTPYENEHKFSDESEYEEGGCWKFGKIINAIEIPNDVLLEIREYVQYEEFTSFQDTGRTLYKRLSEIRLEKFDIDNENFSMNTDQI